LLLLFGVTTQGFVEYLRTNGWSFLNRGSLYLRTGHYPIGRLGDYESTPALRAVGGFPRHLAAAVTETRAFAPWRPSPRKPAFLPIVQQAQPKTSSLHLYVEEVNSKAAIKA